MSLPRMSSLGPRAEGVAARRLRDPYANLLRDARPLRRDQASARETWLAALTIPRKEEVVFEFEMLLKGLAAWANPRNHPRRPGSPALSARNFRPHLLAARAALGRVGVLTSALLGPQRHALDLGLVLPMGFTEESPPEPPPTPSLPPPPSTGVTAAPTLGPGARDVQVSPHQSLVDLRHGLSLVTETVDGLLALGHVPFRLFFAALSGVGREVRRAPLFNPLYTLEFRPEFDRIRMPEVLEAMQSVEGDGPHRLVSMVFLAHFRLLRLNALIAASAAEGPDGTARAMVLLAALRAESQSLLGVLFTRAPAMLCDPLEREFLRVPASELRARFEHLTRDTARATRIRGALQSGGATLRAELRRTFQREIAPCDAATPPSAEAFARSTRHLRDALQSSVLHIVGALRSATVDPERIFGDRSARGASLDRLRRSAWMFTVVLRAFGAKAHDATAARADSWEAAPTQDFARDFLRYFNAFGHAVATDTRYPHLDRLTLTLLDLRDADFLDPALLRAAVTECEAFGAFLVEAIERLDKSPDLAHTPLDKETAAGALMLFLQSPSM